MVLVVEGYVAEPLHVLDYLQGGLGVGGMEWDGEELVRVGAIVDVFFRFLLKGVVTGAPYYLFLW